MNIGESASLSAPMISLNSNDVFLAGILNAPSGKIMISSTNTTVIASGAQTNVGGNSIIQTSPKAMVNWNALNIEPGASVNVGSSNASWSTLNRINGQTGYTLLTGTVSAPKGGSIVLTNTNGVISPASTIFNVASNISAEAGTGSALIISGVPEPKSYLMMLLGLASLGFVIRRQS